MSVIRSIFPILYCFVGLLSFDARAKHQIDFAPSVELLYKIKSSQKGIPVSGDVRMEWKVSDGPGGKKSYSVSSETRVALFGKILNTSSVGVVTENGLSPDLFIEKRFRRQQMQTSFDRPNKRLIFSSGDPSISLQGGEQDRLSITWQIVSLARQAGNNLASGHEWKILVAGIHDVDLWIFKVQEKLRLRTELGDLDVLHIQRAPLQDASGQHLDLWLAPNLDYYPIRINFMDGNGDSVDQKIIRINKL